MNPAKVRSQFIPLSLIILFVLATWPVWRWLWGEWLGNDYYGHGFFIVPITLYLTGKRLNHAEYHWSRQSGGNRGLILLALGMAGYLFFFAGRAYYLAAFAMIALIGGLLWTFGGDRLGRELAFPVAFLTLMIPLPFIEKVTLPLALFTGVCSTAVTSWLGLDVTVTGTAVSLPNTDLTIGAQCSGINSIIALFTLTVLLAYILDGPLWGRLTLTAMSIPLALLGNVLRVGALLFAARYWGVDTAFQFYHNYSGFVVFLLISLLLIPLSRILQCKTLRYELL
ncbi:MAG: exosortase/archaeosortase family protein [Chloroflexi bacterium]|nr:exosortase/archaeosortase family protein [Chloroflexota bacterium]